MNKLIRLIRPNTAGRVRLAAPLGAQGSASASTLWLHALALVVLLTGFVGPTRVAAYNVCSDDDMPCTHEVMTEEALQLFEHTVKEGPTAHPFAAEIREFWAPSGGPGIKTGVGIPDQLDPLYGNGGPVDALITITHFWQPDQSLGAPMEFNVISPLDDYPNAYQAARALWTRALGEYAAGNKVDAYQYLGMVAHFLGDQSIPTHAHNDTHGPDILDDDAFEEWMSSQDGGSDPSPRAVLTSEERSSVRTEGILQPNQLETEDQLLWLFLNTNQVADYFASDDVNGNTTHPVDPYVHDLNGRGWAQDALDQVATACAAEPAPGCPTTTGRLVDNDFLPPGQCSSFQTGICNNDNDGDLSLIRRHSYLHGIRAIGALFALWEQAIQRPILTLTIYRIEEIGEFNELATVAKGDPVFDGLDDLFPPDYYVQTYMGYNSGVCMVRGGNCPEGNIGPGWRLEDRNGNFRINDKGFSLISNMTRWNAFGPTLNQKAIMPHYHFGRSYSYDIGRSDYMEGVDLVELRFSVWDQDDFLPTEQLLPPYFTDDLGDYDGSSADAAPPIQVDLAKCLSGADGGVIFLAGTVLTAKCAPSPEPSDGLFPPGTLIQSFAPGVLGVGVNFSVAMVQTNTPPTADAGGPYMVNEGSSVALDGSGSTDPDGDALMYEWDLDNDGVFDDATGVTPTFPAAGLDGPSSRTVRLRVTDDGSLTDTSETTVSILNVSPTVRATGATIYEHDADLSIANADSPDPAPASGELMYRLTVTNNGPGTAKARINVTIDDPGTQDTFNVVINWGDGSPADIFGRGESSTGTQTFAREHVYRDANPTSSQINDYTVTITATDDDGGTSPPETIKVILPPADVQVTDTLPSGVSYVSDDSGCAHAAGIVTCGIAALMPNESKDIKITVRVDAGLVDETGLATITNDATVTSLTTPDPDTNNNLVLEDTLVLPGCAGVLATIAGTPGMDSILGTTGDDVIATLAGIDTIIGRDGNDKICGGSGLDNIVGGSGNDVIEGGSGNDNLVGGSGFDTIDGGPGNDQCLGETVTACNP